VNAQRDNDHSHLATRNSIPGLRGVLLRDEPLARHTSWRVGGPARSFYQPADRADLVAFLQQLPAGEPVYWLGLGSNLLVRDGGIAGTVIATQAALASIERIEETTVRVEAGVPCAKAARLSARMGLVGAEFLAGIPGTMGGALAMNAGAFGSETWTCVHCVQSVDRSGGVHTRTPAEYRIGYRSVRGPADEWFLAADLRLAAGDTTQSQARIRELLDRRNRTQPTNQPSCGSVFRNPPNDHAARLIEAAGLKGRAIGGACVSEKHANFIVNTGAATAADIEALIEEVSDTVERVHGIRLVTEVLIVGEKK